MVVERCDVAVEDCWNVEALYPTVEEWYREFDAMKKEKQTPHWPFFSSFKGRLAESVELLSKAIEEMLLIDRKLSKLFTYAHLRHDEDLADSKFKEMYEKIFTLFLLFQQEKAWFEPEVLSIPKEVFENFLANPILEPYQIFLKRLVRMQPYTLDARGEELMALSAQAINVSSKIFSAFNNADLKFSRIQNSRGEYLELSHSSYLKYLRDEDRELRKQAFKTLHQKFGDYENTLAELINGQVQKNLFSSRARGFKNCLEAALFPFEVDTEVYHQLIRTVRAKLSVHHRYLAKRKQWMGLDELRLYDLSVPLVKGGWISRDYLSSARDVCDSVGPLGKEYQNILEKGLFSDRWVDRYENARKRSGAYSGGCYDSMPYVLMNFQGQLSDVKTLAHECGHSMHSFFSRKNQPYQYSDYAIFVAEVASTFNEELLIDHLLKKASTIEEQMVLINQRLDDIRATFFRQTMFAEFELKIHELAEQGEPLTASLLKQLYRELNRDYFGPDVVFDEEVDWEWGRIPHFYYNFYVYQYALGISAACALFEQCQKEEESTRKKYLHFLSSGCSKGPLDLLAEVGVDMRGKGAIEAIIHRFDGLVAQLGKLYPE